MGLQVVFDGSCAYGGKVVLNYLGDKLLVCKYSRKTSKL